METNDTDMREEPAMILCRILSMPIKRRLYVTALILFFMALCVAVFAGEPGQQPGLCDLQGGLAGTLNLSQEQCKKIQELARMAQRAESEQRRALNTEQIKKMNDSPYGYGTQGYGPQGYGRKLY